MEFAVSRDATALVTLHGGAETTARDDAVAQLEDALASPAVDGTRSDWDVVDAAVHEHPTAPFEPYTIAVSLTGTVVVDAPNDVEAQETGADALDRALDGAGIDDVSYASDPAVSPA